MISISQLGHWACWLLAGAVGGGPALPRGGRPSVCLFLNSHPDTQATWKQQEPLLAELDLEILAKYSV